MRSFNGLIPGLAVLGAVAGAPIVPASAGDADAASQLIACVPARSDVASVSIERLRFGSGGSYVWAKANVRLSMRDGSAREYSINGRAEPIEKQLAPNQADARFAYPEFTCTVTYPAITSVRNCHSDALSRACEVGVTLFGAPASFEVSLMAERTTVFEATMP